MGTQSASNSKAKWTGLGIGITAAALLGIGLPYALTQFATKETEPEIKAEAATTKPAEAPPPPPPKVEFLGVAQTQGNTAVADKDPNLKTGMSVDDALVVWLKVTPPKTDGSGPAGGGSENGNGPGRRGARNRLTFAVRDDKGQRYSHSLERLADNVVAMHLKKGYGQKPQFLKVTQLAEDKEIASWTIDDVPAPKIVLPDDSLKGKPQGEIRLREDRTGRISATMRLTMNLDDRHGIILMPADSTYTKLDRTGMEPMMVAAGMRFFEAPIPLPNAQMARRVSFDTLPFEGVDSSEIVTFKTARIEDRFGQPTLVVDQDEEVKLANGLRIVMPKQALGPTAKVNKIRPDVTISLRYDYTGVKESMQGLAPGITLELLDSPAKEFGLEWFKILTTPLTMGYGQTTFRSRTIYPPRIKAGTFKYGPVGPIRVKVTVTQPVPGKPMRLVLPVNPDVEQPPTPSASAS